MRRVSCKAYIPVICFLVDVTLHVGRDAGVARSARDQNVGWWWKYFCALRR